MMLILSVGSLSAYESGNKKASPLLMQIATKQAESIRYYDGERVYLKAEKIYPTSQGPVLYHGGSSILLPNLSADDTGYYLSCRSKDDYYFRCPNPDCGTGWWFTETWSPLCPSCGTPGE